MKKSNPKVKKYLSDGTEAKVNMLVSYLDFAIHKITALRCNSSTDGITINRGNGRGAGYKGGWATCTSSCRKATPEERKQYYAALNS